MKKLSFLTLLLTGCLLIFSCTGDDEVLIHSTGTQVQPPTHPEFITGFYLLNEGNMGSNKCTLDFFDYTTGYYHKNIYAETNPSVVMELGDVGNDIQIYGDKLYAVINCSHFIEVMDKNNARLGYVAKVDTATLQIVDQCLVGYQPEEMVVTSNKLYVANSGGYRFPNYDRTVSVIDLTTFTELYKIDVAINLHRLKADRYGYLYVSSRGDYYTIPSDLYVIDSRTDKVVDKLGIAASELCIDDDNLYLYSTEYSYVSQQEWEITYALIDTRTRKVVTRNFITDGTEKSIKKPYGIAVNPETKEFFVTDAKDYVSPGTLYCFTPEGKKKWSVTTGDIPAHFVFVHK